MPIVYPATSISVPADYYDSDPLLEPPFNPPKVGELGVAALTAAAITDIWLFEVDGGSTRISFALPQGTGQSIVNAAMSALNAVCVDPTRNEQTQAQIFAAYIALNLQYKDVFAQASYVLETGIALLATPTVAAYRTILIDTVTALAPLAGTTFETHFNRERAAQGVPQSIPINTMTLAQCATLDNVLHIWLSTRLLHALIAELA